MSLGRTAALLGAILATVASSAPLHAQHDPHAHGGSMPVGYHEFRLFGGDGRFYISHFPMFSSIHAFQYIVEVQLDEAATAAMSRDVAEDVKHERRYQLSPYRKGKVSANRSEDEEDWVLPDTLQGGRSFTGDIFYLVDGKRRIVSRNATVAVKGAVWKAELNPRFPRPKELTYVLFGTPKAAFLAHQITAPPKPGRKESDFDQIVSVEMISTTGDLSPARAGHRVAMSGKDNVENHRLTPGQRVTLKSLENSGETITLIVKEELQYRQLATQR